MPFSAGLRSRYSSILQTMVFALQIIIRATFIMTAIYSMAHISEAGFVVRPVQTVQSRLQSPLKSIVIGMIQRGGLDQILRQINPSTASTKIHSTVFRHHYFTNLHKVKLAKLVANTAGLTTLTFIERVFCWKRTIGLCKSSEILEFQQKTQMLKNLIINYMLLLNFSIKTASDAKLLNYNIVIVEKNICMKMI